MAHTITLKSFQSFDEIGAGLSEIARINCIVGPNNAGKSKILKAIDRTIRPFDKALLKESGESYEVEIERALTEKELRGTFSEGVSSPLGDMWNGLGKHLGGSTVRVRLDGNSNKATVLDFHPELGPPIRGHGIAGVKRLGLQAVTNQLSGVFERLSAPVYYVAAERDVRPEQEGSGREVARDGTGVTNLLRHIMMTVGESKVPIEDQMLSEINGILWPDHELSRIQVLKHPNSNLWEILLDEGEKGTIPLSQCGSGLRTLFHLLTYTNVVATRSNGKIREGTFLLEEIESSLHPHVQRKLFMYLDSIIELPARVFLTTHSSACLDYFQGHDDAIVTEVFQDSGKTRSRRIEAFQDKCGVLDRLGTRASEALQSNAVIWVEGPSDRIYLKKWFDLLASKLREGIDYSIMFYGGDLLAHLTMSETDAIEEYIRLLRINRNSAIIIDSDKTYKADQIRETKRRVREEAEKHGRLVWLTKGKEVENYIAASFFEKCFDAPLSYGLYEPPWDKIRGARAKGATRAFHTKVEFAEFVADNASSEDFQLDWQEKTAELMTFVRRANGA